jgi:hypothetical protein
VEESLAAFYAYHSQVRRVALELEIALRERYRLSPRTYRYFEVHVMADVLVARLWRAHLAERLAHNPQHLKAVIDTAETASRAQWETLDILESACLERLAQSSWHGHPAESADGV